MEGFGSDTRSQNYDRRLEIVSGKSYGPNLNYKIRSRLPDPPSVPPQVTRASYSGASSVSKPWNFKEPEMKRKRRIAKYKVYTVEGRVKATFKKGLRWIKNKCSQIVHGY
ncbi:DUF3511 domain protein [Quillaja saponaria]|uniref:DUF3511 domain protein n=1 Tax=Quillaja saponaria TaxID=32244 RepID=A0AAD7QB10_QUISA|nr:DUF3511 domain protein [Quillaja saponaria]